MADFKLELMGTRDFSSESRSVCPAISIVIPLYNAEKYISACLESLLAQTFCNFEVIVADDCSTDNSAEIVKSYIPKFAGKLTLLRTDENTGGGALPRNKGLYFSRGEYIFFVDSDDFITKDALENLYTLAKNSDADVIYCERNFETDKDGQNISLVSHQKGKLVEKPTFETEVLPDRVKKILEHDIWGAPWCKFVRRNFLIENEIIFPNVFPCEDYFWTLNLFFFAKKFLRAPLAVYFWRQTENSAIRGKNTVEDKFNLWLNPVILGLKQFDNMMGRLKFFNDNANFRYAMLDFVVKKMFAMSFQAGTMIPQFGIYGAIKREFGKKLGKHEALISMLCSTLNMQQKIVVMNQQKFNQIFADTEKRIAELENELNSLP